VTASGDKTLVMQKGTFSANSLGSPKMMDDTGDGRSPAPPGMYKTP